LRGPPEDLVLLGAAEKGHESAGPQGVPRQLPLVDPDARVGGRPPRSLAHRPRDGPPPERDAGLRRGHPPSPVARPPLAHRRVAPGAARVPRRAPGPRLAAP